MSIFSGKNSSVILHVFAWTILLLIPLYLITTDMGTDMFFIQRVYLRTIIYVIIFYLNFFFLIPRLLFVKKKWKYYVAISSIIIAFYFVNEIVNRNIFVQEQKKSMEAFKKFEKDIHGPKKPWHFDIYNYLFSSILITGFSIGLRMNMRYHENEKKHKDLEKEKLSSELAFLKNQVSPHFFFNTLNNIYSLTEINTKEAQNAILQLSKLMRYLLYESEKGDTKLSNEIAFMKNYIELMKLRLTEKVDLRFSFPENYRDVDFPPLLFVSIIENAFKHGISYRDPSYIQIEMSRNEKDIQFTCKNSIGNKTEQNENSGIGLDNLKKRLLLLFPGKHKLSISQTDNSFEVSLLIEL
jgi:two-component system, LytTR family, sensor kinase